MLQHTYFYFWLEYPGFLPQTSEHLWLVPGQLEVRIKALFVYVLSSVCSGLSSEICSKSIVLELKLVFYELEWSVILEMIPRKPK